MQHTVTREYLRNDNHEVRVFLSVVETIHLWFGYCLVLFNLLYYVARNPDVSYPRTFRTQTIRTQS